jgi:hypothetical protein
MKKLVVMLALSMPVFGFAQEVKTFGEVVVNGRESLSENEILDKLKTLKAEGGEAQNMTIEGVIDGVCQAKGCWMTVTLADGQKMTIKFKDYAFFMPMDAAGKKFVAHGKMFIKTTSVEELRHLAEDAGKSKKEIKKIKKPSKEVRFEADGVSLFV